MKAPLAEQLCGGKNRESGAKEPGVLEMEASKNT